MMSIYIMVIIYIYIYIVDKPEINPEVLYMQKQLNMAKKQISELQSKIFALEARNRTLEGEIHDVSENKSTVTTIQ